jgi:hypothetical protein
LGLGAASALGGAGADKIALNVGRPAEYREHKRPVLVPNVGAWIGDYAGEFRSYLAANGTH